MNNENAMEPRWGRRRFLRQLLAAAGAVEAARLAATPPRRAWGAAAPPSPPPGSPPNKGGDSGITVRPDDPAISAGAVEFPGLITPLLGYVAAPAGGETYPGILLIHDADGLAEHVRDVARRLARVGYVALVPDLLSRQGGTAKVGAVAQVVQAMSRLSVAQFIQDANTAVRYLEDHPLVSKSRVGMLAFGLGGIFSWYLLTQNADLKAAAILYGRVPSSELWPHFSAAILAIYAANDDHDAGDLTDLDAQMKKAGRAWGYKVEPKAGAGFFDDTRKTYVPDAAKDAWKMTLDWYQHNLTA